MASPDFISESVTFETLHLTAVSARCIICGNNPPVFKPNQNGGAYCLPCAVAFLPKWPSVALTSESSRRKLLGDL
jgi:hypothetical protein